MAITVVLNGQRTEVAEPSSVASLVASLGFQQDRVAIEVNGAIVSRARWSEIDLAEGDRLELVHFVGGGTG